MIWLDGVVNVRCELVGSPSQEKGGQLYSKFQVYRPMSVVGVDILGRLF